MGITFRAFFIAISVIFLPTLVQAENWIEFHTEKWTQKTGKQKKKLLYTNRYFYDAESSTIAPSGDITLWVKEISYNDTLYVKKGAPESETVFRRVHFWCDAGRYQILQADTDDGRPNEIISEAIKPGSYYDRLQKAVCHTVVP